MKFRETAVKGSVMVGLVVACFVLVAPAATAKPPKPSKPPIVWISLAGTAERHPSFIYFSANSGSQVHSIKWAGWGKNRAVGRGTYRVTSPPPPGEKNPKGPARIVAWKPINCVPEFGDREGKKVRVYRYAKMLRPVGGGGRKWVDISAFTGRAVCK